MGKMIGKTISHYKILAKLGGGGMGIVYKAEDTKLNRPVALKFLPLSVSADQKAKKRFLLEAQAASALDHPNICTIHEIAETVDGQMYIVMACYEGETLKNKIKSGPLNLKESIDISSQIAGGLSAAHNHNIIHRDIKSANIFVTNEGLVKILDFGLAKLSGQVDFTKTGTTVGTIAYLSPEQAKGEEVDHRTDIWSLGIVMHEMLTGQLPFKGDYEQSVMYSIINEKPEPLKSILPEIPNEIESIINKALAKNREERFQQIDKIANELQELKKKMGSDKFKSKDIEKEQIPSIAVLPFIDMSPQKDQEYFCEGMAEELINALTKMSGLHVVSRTSSFQFKEKGYNIQEIGKKLNVKSVLEGAVRKAGSRIRITAQLVNTEDGYHLWSEKFDRDMEDIFVIQDEISLKIVENLKVKLFGSEKTKLLKRHTVDQEAFQLYLKGRYFWKRRHQVGYENAIQFFQQAIDKDPLYALPYIGMADCYNFLGCYGFLPPTKAYPIAKAAIKKALEIDDILGEAHTSLGWIKMFFDWDWQAAEREFKHAISLNPNYPWAHTWYGLCNMMTGQFDKAIKETKRAQELNPLETMVNAMVGLANYVARKYDIAIDQYCETLKMDPNNPLVYLFQGVTYLAKLMWEEATLAFEKLVNLSGRSPFALGFLGMAHAMSGQKEDARKILDQLNRLSKERYVSSLHIALIYIGLDQRDKVFEQLQKAYRERESFLALLKTWPQYDSLRSDPRFDELIKKIGF
jgi:serine/threonine protein kinase/Flp pilus assembly protein TadD